MIGAKFTFDTEFQGKADRPSPAARARERRTITTEEIDAMCARARAEGETTAGVRATESHQPQRRGADHFAARRARPQPCRDRKPARGKRPPRPCHRRQACRRRHRRAARGRCGSGAAPAAASGDRRAAHRPVGGAPAVIEAIEPRIKEIAHDEGYDGRVILNADPALSGANCRIDWRGGGAERNEQTIEQAIAALIAHRFSSLHLPT